MKRFIKMKDGFVYDLKNFTEPSEDKDYIYFLGRSGEKCPLIDKSEINVLSDNIDELFNRILVMNKGHYKLYLLSQFSNFKLSEIVEKLKKGAKIYGMVWQRYADKTPNLLTVAEAKLEESTFVWCCSL